MLGINYLKTMQKKRVEIKHVIPERKPSTLLGRYLVCMEDMYESAQPFSKHKILKKHKLTHGSVTAAMVHLGYLAPCENKALGSRWIGGKPTKEMAQAVSGIRTEIENGRRVMIKPQTETIKHTAITEEEAIRVLKSSTKYKYRILRVELVEKEVEL